MTNSKTLEKIKSLAVMAIEIRKLYFGTYS